MLILITFADINIYLPNSNLDCRHWWVIVICSTLHNHIPKFIAKLLQLWHSSHFFPRNNPSPQQWQSICQLQNTCILGQLLKSALRNTLLHSPKHLTILITLKLYYKIWLTFPWIIYQVWCLLFDTSGPSFCLHSTNSNHWHNPLHISAWSTFCHSYDIVEF